MKKTITALLLLAALLLTAVSCGGADEPADTNATTTTPAATTTAPTDPDPDEGEDEPAETTTAPEEEDDEPLVITPDLYVPYGSATVDGTIDDSWANAATVTLDAIKTGTPAEDTVVKASMMWDANGLYFLFDITDSDIFQGGTAGDFNNDSIYLYIAEGDDKIVSSFSSFFGGIYQFALINKDLEMMPRRGQGGELQNVQSAYTVTDTGIVMEFSYTPSAVPVEAGNRLLVDYQYNDSGATGARKGGKGWYNVTDGNEDSSLWGLVELLAEGATAPAE